MIERRRDELAAVDDGHSGIGQKQITGRHGQPGDWPLEVPPADQEEPHHQPDMGKNGEHARDNNLRRLLFERRWQKGLDGMLDGRVGHRGGRLRGRLVFPAGRLRRVPCGSIVDRQADRFSQQQTENANRETEQASGVQVRLQERPAPDQDQAGTARATRPNPERAR